MNLPIVDGGPLLSWMTLVVCVAVLISVVIYCSAKRKWWGVVSGAFVVVLVIVLQLTFPHPRVVRTGLDAVNQAAQTAYGVTVVSKVGGSLPEHVVVNKAGEELLCILMPKDTPAADAIIAPYGIFCGGPELPPKGS